MIKVNHIVSFPDAENLAEQFLAFALHSGNH